MKLQPLVSWWLILPYLILITAYLGRQILHDRRTHKRRAKRADFRQWLRRSILLALPILVAIGPSVQGGVSSPGVANLDVIFAVDTTPSMAALDYNGSQQRIEGVKQDMQALAASLKGAHIEIITFDSQANVILPLTTDSTAFSTAVQGMRPQINSYSRGSSIDKPLNMLTQEFKRSSTAYPDHYRLLFYFGDGEQTAETKPKSFSPVARYIDGGAILGYGTAKGAKIVKYTGLESTSKSTTYVSTIDEATNKLTAAVSHTDTAALKKIAGEIKVTYQDRNRGGPVEDLYQASQAALAVDRSQRVVHYLNLYWLAAVPLAGLLFWEWQRLVIKLFALRDHRRKENHVR